LEFTEIVPVFKIVQNELLLTKRGHFRRWRRHGREVLPQHNFSDVRSDRGCGRRGGQGSFTISRPEEPGDFLKKNDRDLSEKKF
jgi:hypothetical protein